MIASSFFAAVMVAGALVAQSPGLSTSRDQPLSGRTSSPGSAQAGASALPPSMTPGPAIVTGWSTTDSRPTTVRRALVLADSGWPDSAAAALRRALAGLSGRERARALFDLGLVETTTAASVQRLNTAADSAPELRAAAWLSAGEALLVAGYPEAARGWLLASRSLKQGVASERAAFLAGAASLQAAQWAPARTAFSDYLVEYLSGSWQAAARMGIALANEQMGRGREAVEIYRAILVQHRGFDDEPWLLTHLAALLDTDAPAEAVRLRQRLRDEYSDYRVEGSAQAGSSAVTVPGASSEARVLPAGEPVRVEPMRSQAGARQPVPVAPSRRDTPVRPAVSAQRPSAASTTAPATQAEVWSLQVGAFRDRERADQQRRRFTVRGWTAEVVRRSPWYTVYAGRYSSKVRAEAARADAVRIAGQDVRSVRR